MCGAHLRAHGGLTETTEEPTMHSVLTAYVAGELVSERLRVADVARRAAELPDGRTTDLPDRRRHRTARRRPPWWRWATARVASG
jgi:hypothetical protein